MALWLAAAASDNLWPMPELGPIPAVVFDRATQTPGAGGDVSSLIAPPYDVLDEGPKRQLLAGDAHNIVAIDLPFTPPKVVGPEAVYAQAGATYRSWLASGVLVRRPRPAVYVYQQTFTHGGKTFHRRGLIANLRVQEFGPTPGGRGGLWPHEQTFAGGKEDRLKLMRACQAQLSPIFGLYRDPDHRVGRLLQGVIENQQRMCAGTTANDGVLHSLWEVSEPQMMAALTESIAGGDVYIADGHHRYHTALNYRNELAAKTALAPDHPANFCLFVLVAMEDPGMIVLPTHRVLGGMHGFSMAALVKASAGRLKIKPWSGGDLQALAQALPQAGPHAVGLVTAGGGEALAMAIATPVERDPLAARFAQRAPAWRLLDVAIVQHLIMEEICQKAFYPAGTPPMWKFPHELEQLSEYLLSDGFQLGLVLQPTPLQAVMDVSQAGELMPQKSTFFYPKLATGLVINPLE